LDKLIITVCPNDVTTWDKSINMPQTAEEISDAVRDVRNAGASIVHVHEPLMKGQQDTLGYNIDGWLELARLIREKSDIIYEHGEGGFPYMKVEMRKPPVDPKLMEKEYDLGVEKPDMIATLLTEVDHDFGVHYALFPIREEIERFIRMCKANNVKPAFEAWHAGSYYQVDWLAELGLVEAPYWFTLFFGATSGVGSPPTIDELLHRIKYIPKNSLWQATCYCGAKGCATVPQIMGFYTHAMAIGGHIRLGMEECPYYWDGEPAKSNVQLVERVVRIARELGREIASPDEARQMLGLPPRK